MPKYFFDVEQQSAEWDALHLARPTSSSFDKIITPTGKQSAQWKGYAHGLIAERLLGRRIEQFSNEWMQWGKDMEEGAVLEYEALKDTETKKVGFVTDDAETIGCSPDRLVGEDGLLEIKSPKPNTFVGYLLEDALQKEYYPQLQGQLYITGREWVDIMSYHPEMTNLPCIIRVKRDPAYIIILEGYINKFKEYMIESYMKIQERLGIEIPKKDMIEQILKSER